MDTRSNMSLMKHKHFLSEIDASASLANEQDETIERGFVPLILPAATGEHAQTTAHVGLLAEPASGARISQPHHLALSDNGELLTGRGLAGSLVSVYAKAREHAGQAVVSENGHFMMALAKPLTEGERINIEQHDETGQHASTSLEMVVPELAAPTAPLASPVDAGAMETFAAPVVQSDQPAAAIPTDLKVTYPGDGTEFVTGFATPGAQIRTVAQTSPYNVEGPSVEAHAPDLTVPQAPHDLALNATGEIVTGEGHAGNTVKVYDANHNVIGTGTVGPDGHFSVTVSPAQTHGETVTVTQTSPYNVEAPSAEIGAPDLTAPEAPYNIDVDLTGTHVTGTGFAGNMVKVYDANGNVIGQGVVGPNGKFDVKVSPAQTHGETLAVKQTSTYGIEGQPGEAHAPDLTPPARPTDVAVGSTGWFVTGKGAPGNTVKVYDVNHKVIGEGIAGSDGRFTVNLNVRQTNGEHLTVTQTSKFAIESQPTDAYAPIYTPDAPTNLVIDGTGTILSGKGSPGNTVKIYSNSGKVVGSGTVGADGSFSVTLDKSYTRHELFMECSPFHRTRRLD